LSPDRSTPILLKPPPDGFSAEYYERLVTARDHWWTRGMRTAGEIMLGGVPTDARVLDAGCGMGAWFATARRLSGGRRFQALDLSWAAVLSGRDGELDVELVQASVACVPLRSDTYNVVLCMDVLQHLEEDGARLAISELYRVLAPGGLLLARTGAAWGRRGVANREDWRLYTPKRLQELVTGAGFDVQRLTYVNAIPGLWAALVGKLKRTRSPGASDRPEEAAYGIGIPSPAPRWRNALLGGVLTMEAQWLRTGVGLPFGQSLYVLAAKPSS
jgi:SAM-dependent methyltransferase